MTPRYVLLQEKVAAFVRDIRFLTTRHLKVYSRPQEPNQIVHAHRVTGATTARSKLGPGELIDHHIGTLQAPRQAGGNTYEYGQVFMRFRRDDAQFNKKCE